MVGLVHQLVLIDENIPNGGQFQALPKGGLSHDLLIYIFCLSVLRLDLIRYPWKMMKLIEFHRNDSFSFFLPCTTYTPYLESYLGR